VQRQSQHQAASRWQHDGRDRPDHRILDGVAEQAIGLHLLVVIQPDKVIVLAETIPVGEAEIERREQRIDHHNKVVGDRHQQE